MKLLNLSLIAFVVVAGFTRYMWLEPRSKRAQDTVQVIRGADPPRGLETGEREHTKTSLQESVKPFVVYPTVSTELESARGQINNEPKVDTESRDPEWANVTEVSIRSMITQIPNIDVATISVLCATSVCRATGKMLPNPSREKTQLSARFVISEEFYPKELTPNAFPKRSYFNAGLVSTFSIEFARIHR